MVQARSVRTIRRQSYVVDPVAISTDQTPVVRIESRSLFSDPSARWKTELKVQTPEKQEGADCHWSRGGARKKKKVGEASAFFWSRSGRWGFFVLSAPKIVDEGLFVLRTRKIVEPPPSSKKSPPPSSNLSNPKPTNITGSSIQGGARRDGEARREQAGRNADGSVRLGDNRLSYSSGARKIPLWVCLWNHEQRKPFANRGKENPRLNRGLFAGRRPLFVSGCWTSVSTPICSCKPFSCKTCSGRRSTLFPFPVYCPIFDPFFGTENRRRRVLRFSSRISTTQEEDFFDVVLRRS